jgi:signal transduction histidine kinase
MLRTLRNQLIVSHVLPLLIVIPLVGVWLIYTLETQFLLPSVSREAQQDAQLLADIIGHHAEVWQDATTAQALLGPRLESPVKRVMMLTADGHILASNSAGDAARIGSLLPPEEWEVEAGGAPEEYQRVDPSLGGQIVDVYYPVLDGNGQVLGFVRVSHSIATLGRDLLRTRDEITAILIVGLLFGTALGLVLALSVARPLRGVTGAVYDIAAGRKSDKLPEEGPLEVQRLLHAVNHLVERLQRLETARRQLLANVIHELGRPLGALHIALQALEKGALEDQQLRDDLLQGMDEGMLQLENVLDDLALMHDQVLGALELNYQPLQLEEWLPPVLAPWQVMAQEKGLQWQFSLPQDPLALSADPLRLSQALGNLVSNAIKYTPKKGAVTVSAGQEAQNSWIWIAVCDTGLGIARSEQAAIFQPFFRGGKQLLDKSGLGLGLSIALDTVTAHGGRLELESAQGKGSTFTIWLPPDRESRTASESAELLPL